MEVASTRRPTADRQRGTGPDPKNEFGEPALGRHKLHGELLKLGIEVAQSTVSIYMVPRRDRPLQTWKTFLRNHMDGIASIDCLWFQRLPFNSCTHFLSSVIDGGSCCGLR